MELKNIKCGCIKEYADKYKCEYVAGKTPWGVKCDIALPCATQNELQEADANTLVANGCICVAEGVNMPSILEATNVFLAKKILFAPGKASNANQCFLNLGSVSHEIRPNYSYVVMQCN